MDVGDVGVDVDVDVIVARSDSFDAMRSFRRCRLAISASKGDIGLEGMDTFVVVLDINVELDCIMRAVDELSVLLPLLQLLLLSSMPVASLCSC